MGKLVSLHEATALTLPLSDGACLRVTPFRESARVAVSIHGPGGGDAGGVLLGLDRARLLASWLLRIADGAEAPGAAAGRRERPR
jgi:hypothetical protein